MVGVVEVVVGWRPGGGGGGGTSEGGGVIGGFPSHHVWRRRLGASV